MKACRCIFVLAPSALTHINDRYGQIVGVSATAWCPRAAVPGDSNADSCYIYGIKKSITEENR